MEPLLPDQIITFVVIGISHISNLLKYCISSVFLFRFQFFLKLFQFGAVERRRQKFIAVSFALISGPERAIFFRFFVRLRKMVGEFFPATLWVVIIQPILSSAERYYHQLDRGWRFETRPCFKLHPALFRAKG